jgi:hypothetical protein
METASLATDRRIGERRRLGRGGEWSRECRVRPLPGDIPTVRFGADTIPISATVISDLALRSRASSRSYAARLPTIRIERLKVKHPADDDNVWFIKTDGRFEVQLDSDPDGKPPFLIEGDLPDQRRETAKVEEATNLILNWLTSP